MLLPGPDVASAITLWHKGRLHPGTPAACPPELVPEGSMARALLAAVAVIHRDVIDVERLPGSIACVPSQGCKAGDPGSGAGSRPIPLSERSSSLLQ